MLSPLACEVNLSNRLKNILRLAQRGKDLDGIPCRPFEPCLRGPDEGGFAAAQKRVGGLFQRQRRGQGGLPLIAPRLLPALARKQGGIFAIHRFGEADITYGVFMCAENFCMVG